MCVPCFFTEPSRGTQKTLFCTKVLSGPIVCCMQLDFIYLCNNFFLACLNRLVVWRLWPIEPQWHVLQPGATCGQTQWHQVALLQRTQLLTPGHHHDDPTPGLLIMTPPPFHTVALPGMFQNSASHWHRSLNDIPVPPLNSPDEPYTTWWHFCLITPHQELRWGEFSGGMDYSYRGVSAMLGASALWDFWRTSLVLLFLHPRYELQVPYTSHSGSEDYCSCLWWEGPGLWLICRVLILSGHAPSGRSLETKRETF